MCSNLVVSILPCSKQTLDKIFREGKSYLGLLHASFRYWGYARVTGFEQKPFGTRAIFNSYVCSVYSDFRCYLGSYKRVQRLWYESKLSQ